VSSPTIIFDRRQVQRQRARAAPNFHRHDFLFREIKDRLADRLLDIDRRFEATLNLGARCPVLDGGGGGGGGGGGDGDRIFTADLCAAFRPDDTAAFVVLDEEYLPFKPQSLDLVVSNLCLHWVNDVPGTLLQIRQAMKPDGLFLAALLGGSTLFELRDCLMAAELEFTGGAGPRVAPFADIRDAGALLQRAGFALPVTDQDTITVTYDNAFSLMAELRGMGEGSALVETPRPIPPRALFPRAAALYHERYANADGRIPATFQVIYLHGWAPAPSQQQPLKPGSARNRLADVLNTLELPTGERAKPGDNH
jgi:NADH dehydrogenase [ubiquinone] 1 alpha subcomplex assembly factor 5